MKKENDMKTNMIKYKTIIGRMRDSLCPVCGQPVEDGYDEVEVMSSHVRQEASCSHCETKWREYYTLQGIEIEETVDMEVEIEGDLSDIENVPDILEAVLQNKKILPTLIGIDEMFDKLITEKLKEENDG
jgi:hypothetical protein